MLKFDLENIAFFRGYEVSGEGVELRDAEFIMILNELYGEVTVCGTSFGAGTLLVDADPVAFRCSKGDYANSETADLDAQLEARDDTSIDFIDDDLPEEEEAEETEE